jgi:hypothetical protein
MFSVFFFYRYNIALLVNDGTDEAEFIVRGTNADRLIGMPILKVIARNCSWRINSFTSAQRIKCPPPELKAILSNRYKFVVAVEEKSFFRARPSFAVTAIESTAVGPATRC